MGASEAKGLGKVVVPLQLEQGRLPYKISRTKQTHDFCYTFMFELRQIFDKQIKTNGRNLFVEFCGSAYQLMQLSQSSCNQ